MKAVDLAESTGARLHVVAVGRTFSQGVYEFYTETEEGREALRREAQEILDEQVRKIEEAGGTVAVAHLKMGERRDEAIVHLAEDIGADLIVIGSRGFGGLERALLGNVADSVVRPTSRNCLKSPDMYRTGTLPNAENGSTGLYFGVSRYSRPTIEASPTPFQTGFSTTLGE
jgi:nucleotide-binding universal stress UspA family protein